MSALVKIARDGRGIRLELIDASDVSVLREHGPYECLEEERELIFMAGADPMEGTRVGAVIRGDSPVHGLRFGSMSVDYVVYGRFGVYETEADIYDPAGFSIALPPIHMLPWPRLRENESYKIEEQILDCMTERAASLSREDGLDAMEATKAMLRQLPNSLRRYISKDTGPAVYHQLHFKGVEGVMRGSYHEDR